MCIIFFIARDQLDLLNSPLSPAYKLILASNRDEFYSRPAEEASWWNNVDHVVAGKLI